MPFGIGEKKGPTIGVIDSQSVKNVQKSDQKGYDAGKKIKGIKRHIVTDINGLVLIAHVHSVGVQDRDGAKIPLLQAKENYPSLQRFFGDSAYAGKLQRWCFLKTRALLSIVKRKTKEFKILPMRWVVEPTFGWINYYRRLSKHYEHTCKSAKAQIEIATIRMMIHRLAKIIT
jgi:putative transposase